MWFGEFYQREYRPAWEQRDEIEVYIPTKNVLDARSVEKIREEVLKFQRLHHLQMEVERANKIDPNFGFRFTADRDRVEIGVYQKHSKALENQPIVVHLSVDPKANEMIEHSAELGIPATFEAEAIFEGMPNWLMGDVDEHGEMQVSIFPLVQEQPSHLQFEYLDENHNSLFKSKLVEMRLVQPGTKYKRYVGSSQNEPLIFTMIFDAIKPQTSFDVSFNHDNRSVEALDWYFDLLDQLTETKTARIHNLDTGHSHLLENYNAFAKTSEISAMVRQFAKNLAIISKALNIGILTPKKPQEIPINLNRG